MKSYADRGGYPAAKAEGLSPVDNTLRDLYIFISYESRGSIIVQLFISNIYMAKQQNGNWK